MTRHSNNVLCNIKKNNKRNMRFKFEIILMTYKIIVHLS